MVVPNPLEYMKLPTVLQVYKAVYKKKKENKMVATWFTPHIYYILIAQIIGFANVSSFISYENNIYSYLFYIYRARDLNPCPSSTIESCHRMHADFAPRFSHHKSPWNHHPVYNLTFN